VSFPPATEMFQFAGLPPPGLFGSARGGLGMTPAGFPHSDIFGSTSARDSPKLFAACHVLHRLLAPRHPPRALCSLTPFSSWPGIPVSRTGDRDDPLTTRRNRSSSIAETYPVGKVRPISRPHGGPSPTAPAIRWSVASGGGHGSGDRMSGRDTQMTARGPASEPSP
jgi:hypothetical protein